VYEKKEKKKKKSKKSDVVIEDERRDLDRDFIANQNLLISTQQ